MFDYENVVAWRVKLVDHPSPLTPRISGVPVAGAFRGGEADQKTNSGRLDQARSIKGRRSDHRLPRIGIGDEAAAARAIGLVLNEYGYGYCPLPEHDGIAWLELRSSAPHYGELTLSCNCYGGEREFSGDRAMFARSLADAYMSVRSGTVLNRENTAVRGRFPWRLLVLAAAGVVVPEPITLLALPSEASDAAKAARALFGLLAGVRLAVADCIADQPLPMPFSEELVRLYCRLPAGRAARRAIDELIDRGVIDLTGVAPRTPGYRRGAFLYGPVDPAHRERSRSNDRGTAPCSS
jgi:hypothetical protein